MRTPIAWYHERFIHQRRIAVLARHLSDLIAPQATVLDVGCGDGELAALLRHCRPDLDIRGIDVLLRPAPAIPVEPFDGENIPRATGSVDTVILVDVLHHTNSPRQLLREAARASRKQVIVKDHFLQGIAARRTLAIMDHVGNARHGVEIPCNYMTPEQWDALYQAAGLKRLECRERLGLYPPPLCWWFERSLHFIAALEPST
jgi:SAM-dependent methyltransferase